MEDVGVLPFLSMARDVLIPCYRNGIMTVM